MLPVTGIVLTHNEELNLPACLDSLRGVCRRIVVVDSGSADRTAEIARERGAELVVHPFENHTAQWSWALAEAPIGTDWVLGLDADQRVSEPLAQSIRAAFSGGDPPVDGFYLCRRQVFRGRWIRHGGYYPKYMLKLFRRDRVMLDPQEMVEHHFYVRGKTARLRGDLIEENRKEDDLDYWRQKHMRYAELAARDEFRRRTGAHAHTIRGRPFGTPDERTVWLKGLWDRSPLGLRSYLYFWYRYVVRLGFLDGPEGRLFHRMQGLWYRRLIDARLSERLREAKRR